LRPKRNAAAFSVAKRRGYHGLASPANWEPGENVIIAGSVSDDDAKQLFPQGWRSPKPYMRFVPQTGLSHVAG
jgi:hypothetical protein